MVWDRDKEIIGVKMMLCVFMCFMMFRMIGIFYRDISPIPLLRPCKCIWFFTGFERWLLYSSDVGVESEAAISQMNLSVVISLCLILCPSEDLVIVASYGPTFVSLLTFQSTPCRRSSRKTASVWERCHDLIGLCQNARKCHQWGSWFSPLMTGKD